MRLFVLLLALLGCLPRSVLADAKRQITAAEQLRREIAAAVASGKTAPIQSVLARRAVYGTSIDLARDAKSDAADHEHIARQFDRPRPVNVSAQEWRSLRRTWQQGGLYLEAENGNVTLQLLDWTKTAGAI